MSDIHQILKDTFGYDGFRHQQEKIINHVINGEDALVLMPTGGGKSLCYQIPGLAMSGVSLVISPLIALMKDQVDALRLNGVEARYLNSTQSQETQQEVINSLRNGKIKFLYVSPERLFAGDQYLVGVLRNVNLNLVAIDEAHCISQWGHDFRPEYRRIAGLKKTLAGVPFMALTATADPKTKKDILDNLQLKGSAEFVSSFNRENISYAVQPKQNSRDKLVEFIRERKGQSGIVYTLSRKATEQVSRLLQEYNISAIAYHAGLDTSTRAKRQDDFINDRVDVVVATIAFGMGIDKSNVRYVVHLDLPKNLEGYYQETGRAGRDGLSSEALLFFSRGDAITLRKFIETDNQIQNEILSNKLNKMIQYGATKKCRRQYLLEYFGESANDTCGNCDNCTTSFETFDGTIIAQKALSAVSRLREIYGVGYVIDFLRGSASKKIKEEHTWLKTYGVGKDIPKSQWQTYIRNLVDDGYLKIAEGKYPVLKLGVKALGVLYDQQKVQLIKEEIVQSKKTEILDLEHTDLFKSLKELRMKFASQEKVPPYQIFSDKTLIELSTFLPHNFDELIMISGFGQIKMNQYGEAFLGRILKFCKAQNLQSNMRAMPVRRKIRSKTQSDISSSTQLESLRLFKDGHQIPDIARIRKLSSLTIENHLIHFIGKKELDLESIVTHDKVSKIKSALHETQGQGLSATKALLGDAYSYTEIKAVKASL